MAIVELSVELRNEIGSKAAKKIRQTGNIPAIMYGEGEAPLALTVEEKELAKIYRTPSSYNTLLKLNVANSDKHSDLVVISCAVERYPMTGKLNHVDFKKINLKKKIKSIVPLHFEGTPAGVKMGGTFIHRFTELEIECLPSEIPSHISIDISGLGLDQGLHVRDVHLGDNLHILNHAELSLCVVEAPKKTTEEAATEATAATAAPAPAPATEKK